MTARFFGRLIRPEDRYSLSHLRKDSALPSDNEFRPIIKSRGTTPARGALSYPGGLAGHPIIGSIWRVLPLVTVMLGILNYSRVVRKRVKDLPLPVAMSYHHLDGTDRRFCCPEESGVTVSRKRSSVWPRAANPGPSVVLGPIAFER